MNLLAEWPGESKFEDASYAMKPWQLDGRRVVKVRLGQLLLKLGCELSNKPVERRLADCLHKLNWAPKQVRDGEQVYRVWCKEGAVTAYLPVSYCIVVQYDTGFRP